MCRSWLCPAEGARSVAKMPAEPASITSTPESRVTTRPLGSGFCLVWPLRGQVYDDLHGLGAHP